MWGMRWRDGNGGIMQYEAQVEARKVLTGARIMAVIIQSHSPHIHHGPSVLTSPLTLTMVLLFQMMALSMRLMSLPSSLR